MKDWKKVKLGDLLTESKIVSEKPDANKRLTVRLHTEGIEKRQYSKDKKGATKYYIRSKGQFIYGRQNLHKGAFGIIPEELDGFESSADIPAFDVDKSCLPEWIFYFFKKGDFYLKLESLAKGVGSKRINPSQIYDLDILLPTIEEQKSLLEKVADLTKKHDKANVEFENQIKYINQLRQNILEDAFTGKLSSNRQKSNSSTEDAHEIIKKISSEKNRIIKPVNSNIPFKIPKTWTWCRLDDILLKITDGTHHSPPNSSNEKYKYITAKNIKNKGIDIDDITFVSEDVHKKIYSRCNPEYGDILFIKDGATTGVCCINTLKEEFSMLSSVALLKPSKYYINEYLLFALKSPYFFTFIRKAMSGVAITRVTLKILKDSVIPLAPLTEQIYILDKIKKTNELCDNLEIESLKNIDNAQKFLDSSLIDLIGENSNILQKIEKTITKKIEERVVIFDSKTTLMDLVELLRKHGKLYAEDLWKMSKFPENIDAFYAELKHQIEDKKSIKEVENEKGYLELV